MTGGAYLKQLEVENFKSYNGKYLIGPFDKFTAIIGPNGSGKSNLMDAISFVLGIAAQALRSSQMTDLIYRGTGEGGNLRRKASVTAFYVDSSGEEHILQRTITGSGVSEYRLNGSVVSYATYSQFLDSQNLLIKARNFLVFQGDVESIASKSPKDLSKLLEQIAGSDELKSEYDRLKELNDQAMEISAFAFNKKRTLLGEMKAVQDQKEDVLKYENLLEEKVTTI
jgi:structural maintenance of chromosome 1